MAAVPEPHARLTPQQHDAFVVTHKKMVGTFEHHQAAVKDFFIRHGVKMPKYPHHDHEHLFVALNKGSSNMLTKTQREVMFTKPLSDASWRDMVKDFNDPKFSNTRSAILTSVEETETARRGFGLPSMPSIQVTNEDILTKIDRAEMQTIADELNTLQNPVPATVRESSELGAAESKGFKAWLKKYLRNPFKGNKEEPWHGGVQNAPAETIATLDDVVKTNLPPLTTVDAKHLDGVPFPADVPEAASKYSVVPRPEAAPKSIVVPATPPVEPPAIHAVPPAADAAAPAKEFETFSAKASRSGASHSATPYYTEFTKAERSGSRPVKIAAALGLAALGTWGAYTVARDKPSDSKDQTR